jgi:hypothetical protein
VNVSALAIELCGEAGSRPAVDVVLPLAERDDDGVVMTLRVELARIQRSGSSAVCLSS